MSSPHGLAAALSAPLASAAQVEPGSVTSAVSRWVEASPLLAAATGFTLLALAAWLALLLTRRVLLRALHRVVSKTRFTWDDTIHEHRVFQRLAHVAPALVVYYGVEFVPAVEPVLVALAQRVAMAFMVIMLVATFQAFLGALNSIYVAEYPQARSRPIKGYLQIVAIFLWIGGGIVAVSLLVDRSPLIFLSGIGALTAVLMLVFRNTILSFVASIQIASNDMVRVGDWIEMSQYGADGDVIDIALHTVKVQNWDKTITTIPTFKLVEESFRNWRGMSESGGRRIKRSLMVDMNTVRFLTAEEVEELGRLELLHDYLERKREELAGWKGLKPEKEGLRPTPRRLTNIGTFRAYVQAYLEARPDIHDEMTLLVRQLEPTPQGLPIQVYCFTNVTAWAVYEGIQADIFDHLLSIAPEFGLRVYQEPAGSDLRLLVDEGQEGREQEQEHEGPRG